MTKLRKSIFLFAGLGLMLASSGLDGAYMAKMMPWAWMGYLLNIVADICDMAFSYKYTAMQRGKYKNKRKLARVLLAGQAVAIAYSWFFSWLQLRHRLKIIEPIDYKWIAVVAGGFVPLLLAFTGVGQALEDTRAADLEKSDEQVIVTPGSAGIAEVGTRPPVGMPVAIRELTDRQLTIATAMSDNPMVSQVRLAEITGVSRSTIRNDILKLQRAGVLQTGSASDNGGWEVVMP